MSATAIRIALVASLSAPAAAFAAHSDWVEADEAQIRLLLAPPEAERIKGGIEIVLTPSWYTYWRNPGESGVPPVFDFSRSENVADVAVRYPAPIRYDDGASVSLIYRDEVVFPLTIAPRDAGLPITLRVDARFGVCSKVCIPTSASAEVASSPADDPLSAARIQSFEPRVPRPPEPGRFDIEKVTVADGALVIDVRIPQSEKMDLFSDPPAGWYLSQPAFVERSGDISRYRLSLNGKPADAEVRGQAFTFVAVSGGEAIEKAVEIR